MKTISGGVTAPKGFIAGGISCGIKKNSNPDLAIIYSENPAVAAGIFTTNKVQAAPVILSKQHLNNSFSQAIIANSGNANACLGEAGLNSAQRMAQAAAILFEIPTESVLIASTGVIGQPLPVEKIENTLGEKKESFLSQTGGSEAAQAIMTTDTFPKEYAVEFRLNDIAVKIGGTAKGSGMIHPNMATLLSFITTDLSIEKPLLQKAIARAGELSFNRITVDRDTSTNDCLLILANGQAGNPTITHEGIEYQKFLDALTEVCRELAKMIAKDGEGATKFVEVKITNASTEAEAVQIGKSIATSNLVKTALFGEDANWGRILCAAGYSGVDFDPAKVDIYLGDLLVCQGGIGLAFNEDKAKSILSKKDILITVAMGRGSHEASIWTCDFSYDYVKINGSYRT